MRDDFARERVRPGFQEQRRRRKAATFHCARSVRSFPRGDDFARKGESSARARFSPLFLSIFLPLVPSCFAETQHARSLLLVFPQLRFKRMGRKKRPFYRLVAIDSRRKREGLALEELGFYNPLTKETSLNAESIQKWIKDGAEPSETVAALLKKAMPAFNEN